MNSLQLLQLPRARATLSLGLGVMVVLCGIGLSLTSNLLIARAGFHPGLETLALLIVSVRFFGIARAGVRYAERLVSHDLTFKALSTLRLHLFDRLESRSPLQLTFTRDGDAFERFLGDVETLQHAWLRAYAPTMVAVLISSLTVAGLFMVHPRLAVTALTGFVLCGVFVPSWAQARTRSLGLRLTDMRATHTAHLQDVLSGAEELLMLGAMRVEVRRLEASTNQIRLVQTGLGRVNAQANAIAGALAWLTALALLIVTVSLLNRHAVPLEMAGALAFAVLASFEAILPLGAAATGLARTQGAAQRVSEAFQDSKRADVRIPPQLTVASPAEPRKVATLRFEHVHFAYDSAPLLEDVTFSLEPGRWLAVIGPTGAGKSTLTSLALRFCDPQLGSIRLNGTDLRDLPLETIRDSIAFMPQRGHLFNTTLRQNLLIAKPTAGDDSLWAVLEAAELADTVRAMPAGLDTLLHDDGARLSAGERQRLLLARALLREAPVLILDEPSANLDAETERDLLRTLRHLTQHQAVLLITHRLQVLQATDATVALDNGRIVARGQAREVLRHRL